MVGADASSHSPEPVPADDGNIGPELSSCDVANDAPDLLLGLVVARTKDAVALLIMSEGGELHVVFVDYLLVT